MIEIDVSAPRILIVEDEPALRQGVEAALRTGGYHTYSTEDGVEGLHEGKRDCYSLIVLDLMLPGIDGFEICRKLREERVATPIIILTARGGESDRVRGLDLGADDYVTKPFSLPELLARVRSVLRRSADEPRQDRQFECHGLIFDLEGCTVVRDGNSTAISAREAAIIAYLRAHRDRVIDRRELLHKVWGYPDQEIETRTVDAHIARLRRKIEVDPAAPAIVVTVRGRGYQFGGPTP